MLHPKLLAKLVELRNILERPVYITSGYRCPRYNQKIGGVVNSYHCIGLAADIKVKDINLIELLEICENIDFNQMEGITREKGDTLYFSPCIKCGNIKEECPPFPPFGQLF
jgi:hypothetical protein